MDGWDVDVFGSILAWAAEVQGSRGATEMEVDCSIYFDYFMKFRRGVIRTQGSFGLETRKFSSYAPSRSPRAKAVNDSIVLASPFISTQSTRCVLSLGFSIQHEIHYYDLSIMPPGLSGPSLEDRGKP